MVNLKTAVINCGTVVVYRGILTVENVGTTVILRGIFLTVTPGVNFVNLRGIYIGTRF